jgi:Nuclease-related domain
MAVQRASTSDRHLTGQLSYIRNVESDAGGAPRDLAPNGGPGGSGDGPEAGATAGQPSPRSAVRRKLRGSRRRYRVRLSSALAADPRLPIWISRAGLSLAAAVIFGLWLGWRIGLTIAVLVAAGDTLLRSRTTAAIPAAVRVTKAQRQTARRLAVLKPAGYLALNARCIPGTKSVIDHLVVGPAGIFAIDSEMWDRRLPVRVADQMLYHGPVNQRERLRHARWEANQAASLLGAELGRPVPVRPVMVIYGPKISWTIATLAGVDVFAGGTTGTYFRRQSRDASRGQLDTAQVAAIYEAAAKVLPPLAPRSGAAASQ